ncbi:MAG: phosphatidylserine/phosphatidylglycerophosphate/cardiolipin synthase family protein [Candidatus Dormibacteraeota bacterium]|nr:phosphatidylserine/phosphatidylglycerophosphate/cardiolipin synthase family protein [Candidatus Dormibacteraeota bacterium]
MSQLLAAPGVGQQLSIEMYEFGRQDLAEALLAARGRGAEVRLIVDRTVPASARVADWLAARGVSVRAYPVDDRIFQIDHVKLVLVPGAALVTGMNWGDSSAANHDYGLETRTPPVLDRLREIFEQDWSLAGGAPAPITTRSSGPVLQTAPGDEVRKALLSAIGSAGQSIVAEIFTLTDPEVVAGFGLAHRRGVQVRLLLDPGQEVNLAAYRLLQSAGVSLAWFRLPPGAKLHAKAALFDGRELLVGSANWSQGGLSVNHELDLLVTDHAACSAFASRFERDWQKAVSFG